MKEIVIDGVTYILTPKTEEAKQEPKLPKTWEELEEINGFYVLDDGESLSIDDVGSIPAKEQNKNTFATKEQAEASIALAQLSQLLKVYRGDWTPDWTDTREFKYGIVFIQDELHIHEYQNLQFFLSLPTEELAQEFLDNFRDLILTAKHLL